MMKKKLLIDTAKKLGKDRRGAVLAEFVIAIVPILTMFFTFTQLAHLATARLVLKHGAIVGARAASVITNGNDNTPDQNKGDNKGTITEGVRAAMVPWSTNGTFTGVSVDINDRSEERRVGKECRARWSADQ